MIELHPSFDPTDRVWFTSAGVEAKTIPALLAKYRLLQPGEEFVVRDYYAAGARFERRWPASTEGQWLAENKFVAPAPSVEQASSVVTIAEDAESRAERVQPTDTPPARPALPSQEELDAQAEAIEVRAVDLAEQRRQKKIKAETRGQPGLSPLESQMLDLWSRGLKTMDIVFELRVTSSAVGYALLKGRRLGDVRAERRLSEERCAGISVSQRGRPRSTYLRRVRAA